MLSGQDGQQCWGEGLPEPEEIEVGAWEDPPLAFAPHPIKPLSAPRLPAGGRWNCCEAHRNRLPHLLWLALFL